MQTRKMSMVETAFSTAVGYSVATLANFYILPLFGAPVSWSSANWIGVIFTVISLIRGYLVRRFFNWIQFHRQPEKIATLAGLKDQDGLDDNVRY